MKATHNAGPQPIDPSCLYPLQAFYGVSGISETRVREARRDGFQLPSFAVGRRRFIRGADAINYIEMLAAQQAARN